MNIYAIGLVVSILLYLIVGNYAGRKVKHLEDYFVAGRQAPTLLIVGTLVASLMSTNAFMGEAGLAYSGFATVTIILTAINGIGYVAGALFFGKYLRRSRSLTLAEYFGHRFNSRRVQRVAGITIVAGCTGYLMTVSQGVAAIINEVTGLPFGLALLIGWASYTLFTLYSGSRGVVITDTIMFVLFGIVAFVGLAFILDGSGGWFASIKSLAGYEAKPGIISWDGMSGPGQTWESSADLLIYSVILGVAWSIVVAVSPWQASRYLMAKDEHTVVRSSIITAGVLIILYIALSLAAAAVNLLNPGIDPAQEVMIWAALNAMPTLAGVLMMAGIMAAGLSSASTFLSLTGFSVSNDIFSLSEKSDDKRLRNSRFAMFGAGLVALGLAYFVPQGYLYWIVYFVGTLFASSWGPVAFMSVWSSRITEAGAFWGIIMGLAGNIIPSLLDVLGVIELPTLLNPILLGVVVSYLTVVLVSRRGQVTQEENRRRERMHVRPPSEQDPARLNRTLAWARALIVFGVALAALMLIFYALPYQQATLGDSVMSGEVMLSLGVGAAMVACGVLAWWGAARAFDNRGTRFIDGQGSKTHSTDL